MTKKKNFGILTIESFYIRPFDEINSFHKGISQ